MEKVEERRINTDPEKKRGEKRKNICTLEGHPQIIMDRFTSVLRHGADDGCCHSNGRRCDDVDTGV